MAGEPLRTTLAYTKSPKTSRRTTFQDELQAAVSARARHTAAERNASSYSDDFDDDDDDDDILNELLKTRRKKMDIFKTGKTKAKTNDFKLSDEEEEENVRPKKVSFLKSHRRSSPVQDDQPDTARRSDTVGSSDSQGSPPERGEPRTHSSSQPDPPADWKIQSESALGRQSQSDPFMSRRSLSESPLPLNSENSRWDSPLLAEGALFNSPLPVPSERGEDQLRVLIGADGEQPPPQPRERSARQRPAAGSVEHKPPRPRPRPRAALVGSSAHDEEDGPADTPSSRAATSSVSLPLSFTDRHTTTSASSERLGSSGSDGMQCAEEEHHAASVQADSLSPSLAQLTIEALLSPVEGAGSTDLSLDQNREDKYTTPLEENPESSEAASRLTASRQSQRTDKSQDRPPSSRPASSRKSKSACSYTAESRYLGTLKVLDQKKSLQENQPDAADSLRAAVYQDWLKKKEEKLQAALRIKQQEEKLKVEKKMEEEMSKKADAKASYEAWKEKKREVLTEKLREKQEAMRKEQKEKEEKEEKKETATRVFEKWKQEHDDHLQEQHRKQAQQKTRLKDKKEREQEERRKECSSSFSRWSERKKDTIQEKLREEREKEKIKEIEEKYQKEEREKMALEVYEKWLKRKEFQQKRDKQEKKIKAIIQDEPPPPWSPPNRTVPFGK